MYRDICRYIAISANITWYRPIYRDRCIDTYLNFYDPFFSHADPIMVEIDHRNIVLNVAKPEYWTNFPRCRLLMLFIYDCQSFWHFWAACNVSNDFRRSIATYRGPARPKKSIDTHIVSNKRIDISSRSRRIAIYRFFCVFVGPSPTLRC